MFSWICDNWDIFMGPFLFVTIISAIKIYLDLKGIEQLTNLFKGTSDEKRARRNAFGSFFNLVAAILLIIGGVWSVYNAGTIDKNIITRLNNIQPELKAIDAKFIDIGTKYASKDQLEFVEWCIRLSIISGDPGKSIKDSECAKVVLEFDKKVEELRSK